MSLLRKVTSLVSASAVAVAALGSSVTAMAASEFAQYADALAEAGIINTQATESGYRLGDNITRAEMAKIALKVSGGSEVVATGKVFADVSADNSLAGAIEAAAEAGIVSKANTNFRPSDLVTRAEMVKMLMAAQGVEPTTVSAGFEDLGSTDATLAGYINAAVAEGYINAGSSFRPNATATRGEAFKVAAGVAGLLDDGNIDDILNGGSGSTSTGSTSTGTTNTGSVVVTGGDLVASLSPETPTSTVAVDAARASLLAFDLSAGSTDVLLKNISLKFVGTGDADELDNLAVYAGNVKVSKGDGKQFDDKNKLELTFDKDLVVKAGTTQTFVVTTLIADTTISSTQSFKVAVTGITSSAANVSGLTVTGNALAPLYVANKAVVEMTNGNKASGTIEVGETTKLAGLTLKETSKKEDAIVKAITFTVSGSVDTDDVANLALYADGVEVASNLSVNSDDEVVADLDYTLGAGKTVKFELKGIVTSSIGKNIQMAFDDADDVYVVGASSEVNIVVADVTTKDIASAMSIDGSEISASFVKSDIDEARPNAEGVLVGTLKLAATSDYTVDSLTVTVKNVTTSSGVEDVIDSIEVDDASADAESGVSTTTGVYTFKDITLTAGETTTLPITIDLKDDTAINGTSLTFTVKVTGITDEENDEEYTGDDVLEVLSTNSFSPKTIDVETASLTITQTKVSTKEIVIGNGIEVVAYKGKLSVGDSDDVTINDITFVGVPNNSAFDMSDVVDSAVLNIGGKTYTADIDVNNIDFTSIAHKVVAGTDNAEFTLTFTLKDSDNIADNDDTFKVTLVKADIDAEDSEGETLLTGNKNVTAVSGTNIVELNDAGSLTVTVKNNGDYKDTVKSTVLAGASTVALGEISLEANEEDAKVKELVLTTTGSITTDFSSTLNNVRIINASTNAVIASNATVTYEGTKTLITFDDDFTIPESSNEIKALIVADLEKFSDKGGVVSAETGDIQLAYKSSDVTGVSSNDDIDVDSSSSAVTEVVSIVPAIVTVSVSDTFAKDDEIAKVTFTVDKGNNELTDDSITLNSFTFDTSLSGSTDVLNFRDDNGDSVTTSNAVDSAIYVVSGTAEITNGDVYTVEATGVFGSTAYFAKNGISYKINNVDYKIVNDSTTYLGKYTESN